MPFPWSSTSGDLRPRCCAAVPMMLQSLPKAQWLRCVGLLLTIGLGGSCGASSGGLAPAASAARQPPRVQATGTPPAAEPPAFFASLVERARRSAARPAVAARRVELPGGLRDMNYDQYRGIRFKPEHSL